MERYIEVKSNGIVSAKEGTNTRSLYEHQKQAMKNLDTMDKKDSFSTLVVLPTGGGKTYTASLWLLKHGINRRKKILWIAHRQMLLDQATESFLEYAYPEAIPNISQFNYRIVSGSSEHDRTIDIQDTDDLLVASKDSLGRNLNVLEKWLKGAKEVYLIVDEAHHSTAKTYRRIIDFVRGKVKNTKLIGLTATPFRTSPEEQGLLSKIYTDGIDSDGAVAGEIGIAYKIDLKELIRLQILARPIFESYYTEEAYGESLGVDDWESISHLDVLPEKIAKQIIDSKERNRLIVNTYLKNRKEYGQMILFAVNVSHAITLTALFKDAGVKAEFIVSDIKDMTTGVTISREKNNETIEEYKKGNIEVLVNVNILTEGVDLPQTKTVFLARPTVSTILMTQMVGRALRGSKAGGTSEAHIVSFVDNWNEHIAWVNPESIFVDKPGEFIDTPKEHQKQELRMIAISKIEEFARMVDDSVDTFDLEKVPFEKRIPVGMYAFTYLEEDGMDHSYQVMVYDSTKEAYSDLMASLKELFKSFGVTEKEYLDVKTLNDMAEQCRNSFFTGNMIPPYEKRDVIEILKYYANKDAAPAFYTFEDIDRNKLDVAAIAKHIWDEDMGQRKKAEYVDSLWENNDDNMLRLFFGRKLYFMRQLEIEITKISDPNLYINTPNVIYGKKAAEDLPLDKIGEYWPEYEKELRDDAFNKSKNKAGQYVCAECGMTGSSRVSFHVDHIMPINPGGKSVPENLQILCRPCNMRKSDKI